MKYMRENEIINVVSLPDSGQPLPSHLFSPRLRSALALPLFFMMGHTFTLDQLKRGAVLCVGGS